MYLRFASPLERARSVEGIVRIVDNRVKLRPRVTHVTTIVHTTTTNTKCSGRSKIRTWTPSTPTSGLKGIGQITEPLESVILCVLLLQLSSCQDFDRVGGTVNIGTTVSR